MSGLNRFLCFCSFLFPRDNSRLGVLLQLLSLVCVCAPLNENLVYYLSLIEIAKEGGWGEGCLRQNCFINVHFMLALHISKRFT